jgi:hypothetical protein
MFIIDAGIKVAEDYTISKRLLGTLLNDGAFGSSNRGSRGVLLDVKRSGKREEASSFL